MRPLRSNNSSSSNWTDDLKELTSELTVCKNTGLGHSTNQIYREDGNPQEAHVYEDSSCHYQFKDNTFLYAVFDGHDGHKASTFLSHLTADLCFSSWNDKKTDEEVCDIIRQAFTTVETGYMQSIDQLLALRAIMKLDLPDGMNTYEAYQIMPDIVEKINNINWELSSGAAVAIALIHNNKLYVANVGNCRVLLCKTDPNSVLKVVQLSIDHDLKNEDELLRLAQIGINADNLRNSTHLGNQENTRCLGNYLVKGGYKEFEDLSNAIQEPVIAEPDIHGGITLDESCRFLLLMSAELYKCIEDATGTEQVNKYIAQCVVEQFREQSTLTGVAQAVVDKVVRLHHDWYMANATSPKSCSNKREDITLLLRNFNYPLPRGRTPTSTGTTMAGSGSVSCQDTLVYSAQSANSTARSSDATSSVASIKIKEIGSDNKVSGYVDFSDFYKNAEAAKQNGNLPDWWDS